MGHPVFLMTRLREKDTAKLLRLSPGLEKDLEFEEEKIHANPKCTNNQIDSKQKNSNGAEINV